MPVPAVSHRNWERTRGLAQMKIGTWDIAATQFGFNKQLGMLQEGNYVEGIADVGVSSALGDSTHVHKSWGKGGVEVSVDYGGRDRAHRPEVEQEVVDELEEWVGEQYPVVPAESLDFDEQLDLFLDKVERFYSKLDCQLVEE